MPITTRYFAITVPQGLSTIKLDSRGIGTCQITAKNVSATAIDGRGILTSVPVARPPAGAVEKGWIKIVSGPTDRHFDVDQEVAFAIKIAVPEPKKGEAPPQPGNYSFRLDVVNIARPDDSGDQSQPLSFAVAAPKPMRPSKLPLVLGVVALVLLVGAVVTWLLLRKPAPAPSPTQAPEQAPAILGIGLSRDLWTRATLTSQWNQVANSCCIIDIAVLPDGTILGVGTDNTIWARATLSSPWAPVANSCCITAITGLPGGTILGIGLDHFLYTRATLTSQWIQVPNSGSVIGVSVMPDGTIVGIGTDQFLYTRATLYGTWVQVPNSCCVTGISVMPDGTIVGIGLDNFLWTRAGLRGVWAQVPNSGSVIDVAAWHK
jgi:hypothetical protein